MYQSKYEAVTIFPIFAYFILRIITTCSYLKLLGDKCKKYRLIYFLNGDSNYKLKQLTTECSSKNSKMLTNRKN